MMSHPVPGKLLVDVGHITVSFALLEHTIQSLVRSLIAEHQRIGQIITVELSFRSLRGLAISLYKERHGDDQDFWRAQGAREARCNPGREAESDHSFSMG